MIADSVELGQNVSIPQPALVNLYGCRIGDHTLIGAFVEVQRGAVIGAHCKISSHSFVCDGVTIEDEVFVGHGVMFTNDLVPRAVAAGGGLQTEADWKVERTLVKKGASIGSGSTILSNITIGENGLYSAAPGPDACSGLGSPIGSSLAKIFVLPK